MTAIKAGNTSHRLGAQYLLLFIMVLACCGCAATGYKAADSIERDSRDLFRETTEIPLPAGMSQLDIEFSVKANWGRILTTYIKHTDPPFSAVVTIDGQSVELTDEPVLEETTGDSRNNPERGTGWRYRFRKRLPLSSGRHHVMFTVPWYAIHVETFIELKSGLNTLHIVPLYNASLARGRYIPQFSNGLRGVTLRINQRDP